MFDLCFFVLLHHFNCFNLLLNYYSCRLFTGPPVVNLDCLIIHPLSLSLTCFLSFQDFFIPIRHRTDLISHVFLSPTTNRNVLKICPSLSPPVFLVNEWEMAYPLGLSLQGFPSQKCSCHVLILVLHVSCITTSLRFTTVAFI